MNSIINLRNTRINATRSKLLLLSALFMTLFNNSAYYKNVLGIYPLQLDSLPFLLSIVLLQFLLTLILLCLMTPGPLLKPVLMLVFISSASAAYYMDSLGIVIDQDMLTNIFQTNISEASDLINSGFLSYLLVLGVLPLLALTQVRVVNKGLRGYFFDHLKLVGLGFIGLLIVLATFYKSYASFFREHKPVRFYSNPIYMVYSIVRYIDASITAEPMLIQPIGQDAVIPEQDQDRELVIMVVGETARADHFSLNGYKRETNRMLAQEPNLINFPDVTSCATSTAVSIPCMFSVINQDAYSSDAAKSQENALDVLKRAGVNILWLDNNSSSKGVADRVEYRAMQSPDTNPVCDIECRDVGMLVDLQAYVDSHPTGDILIVLHQMGNHGPAYYKRYPPEFERFTPVCKSNELASCDQQSIINAYDNAILYTDYFLSQAIRFLKSNESKFETALLYASDHGESLGEHGIYLHGLPNLFAPDAQRKVPAFLWLGDSYHAENESLLKIRANSALTHDNLFHTLLGLFEVDSEIRNESLNLLSAQTQ